MISRRTFMAMAAGAAAVRTLPGPVLGLAVEPAGIIDDLVIEYRGGRERMVTMVDTYLRLYGTQYRFTRYLSDSGAVLSEDVRPLRPYEELTIARLDRTENKPR